MTSSTFPASWPHENPDAVTGYVPGPGGTFVPDLDEVAAMPAAAGLWTPAADRRATAPAYPSLPRPHRAEPGRGTQHLGDLR